MGAILDAIKGRRSVRIFQDRPVRRETVAQLIEAAQWAPSACDKQMWEFLVVSDKTTLHRIVDEAGAMEYVKDVPAIIYVLYPKGVNAEFFSNIQSAAAAIQNMLLYAPELGLGTSWIAACGDRQKVHAILGIPEEFLIVAGVVVGYPKEQPKPPKRREMDALIHYERYQTKIQKVADGVVAHWTLETFMDYRMRGVRAVSPYPASFEDPNRAETDNEVTVAVEALNGAGKILDVLPFAGVQLIRLLRGGLTEISAYETDETLADFIERKRKNMAVPGRIDFRLGPLPKIPAGDAEFDGVTCFRKVEKVPVFENLLLEIHRILKPGGRLVLSFRNAGGISSWISRWNRMRGGRGLVDNEGPIEPTSERRVRRLLERHGFSVRRAVGLNLLPKALGGERLGLVGYKTRSSLRSACRTIVLVAERRDG